MNINIADYGRLVPYLPLLVSLLVAYKVIFNMMTKYDDGGLMMEGASAPAISRGGGYLGVALAALGSKIGSGETYWRDIGMFAVDGVVAIALFAVAMVALDKVVLPTIENDHELASGNNAVAVVEASGFVALGAIMCGSFSGSDPSFWHGMASAGVFSVLGLVGLLISYKVFDSWQTKYGRGDLDALIGQRQSMADAVDVAGIVLAQGIVLGFSITGDSVSWGEDLVSFFVAFVMSSIGIAIARVLARPLLPRKLRHAKHHNVAEAIIVAFVTVGFAVLIGVLMVS